MFLKWNPIYSVNVKELDEQHQKIFEIINHVYKIKNSIDEEQKVKVIRDLKEYGDYHLKTEEKYFEEFAYPNKEDHIKQHDEYRAKIFEFEKGLAESKELIVDLSKFLRDWWIGHIQTTDHEYSDFFNDKGLY